MAWKGAGDQWLIGSDGNIVSYKLQRQSSSLRATPVLLMPSQNPLEVFKDVVTVYVVSEAPSSHQRAY